MISFKFFPSEFCFIFKNEEITVKYRNNPDALRLLWIETEADSQRQGHATNMLNHIVENILQPNQTFEISAPDYDTVGFYSHWLKKRGIDSHRINQLIDEDDSGFSISIPYADLSSNPSKSPIY
ncbi:MAG: hypothetical protein U1E78_12165 [Gammaproteobacteria bacterium]